MFGDAVWAKYGFGRREKIKDPRTGKWAVRNIFWQSREGEWMHAAMVVALGLAQERGCAYVYAGG